jgi:Flp pilus assembly protein TadG
VVVVAMPVLLAAMAMTMDLGRVITTAQICQNVADSCALAACNQAPSSSQTAANQRIADDVSANNAHSNTTVTCNSGSTVYYANGASVPKWGTLTGSEEAATVAIQSTVNFYFARAVGLKSTTVTRTATALLQPGMGLATVFAAGLPTSSLNGLTVNGSSQTVYSGDIRSNSWITINGVDQDIQGNAHADSTFLVNGSSQTITGRSEWVTKWTLNGSSQSVNPVQVASDVLQYPFTYTTSSFGTYTYNLTSYTLNGSNLTVPPGTYYVNGNVLLNGSNISLPGVTFVATGTITLNGSNFGPASPAAGNGVLFWTSSSASNAITINGASGNWSGTIFAPNGGITFNGSNQNVQNGSIMAQEITVNGSGTTFHPTAGSWGAMSVSLIE